MICPQKLDKKLFGGSSKPHFRLFLFCRFWLQLSLLYKMSLELAYMKFVYILFVVLFFKQFVVTGGFIFYY
jgi:hypothetical protein